MAYRDTSQGFGFSYMKKEKASKEKGDKPEDESEEIRKENARRFNKLADELDKLIKEPNKETKRRKK